MFIEDCPIDFLGMDQGPLWLKKKVIDFVIEGA